MFALTVVIVNYRTSELAVLALDSLAAQIAALPGARVLVVDNASGDDSAARLAREVERRGWSAWVKLVPLATNAGFGAGNNAVLREALGTPRTAAAQAFLLLNPDTVVRPGAVDRLLQFLERHPRAGIVGPRLEEPDGTQQRSSFRFPSVWSELEQGLRLALVTRLLARRVVAPPARDDAHPAEWLSGACLLVRRDVLEEVGLFDEGYFLYFEETDLCRRAQRAGWECWYAPEARVVHLGGQSPPTPAQARAPTRRSRAWLASRRRYFRLHHGLAYLVAADVLWTLGYASWRVRRLVQRKPDPDPPSFLLDFVRYNFLHLRS